ncbi:hypothetical protein [Ammoniphilus resinae]|uniref:DUF2158 domain-containing protein n=1 Tax=Ammoniphilus resinae TaxID=861532 RepID=A0ABS4GSB6_9BACL|nr:hypothetical protein [Ammoniphilus resinae]MBP1933141.1 hypothetical protein [Ammoniphilus resinae]
MLNVGDCVVYSKDGARGIVLQIGVDNYCVIWEDFFVSWEFRGFLLKDELLTRKQTIRLKK